MHCANAFPIVGLNRSSRRQLLRISQRTRSPLTTRSFTQGDVPNRSPMPTVAPPRLNIYRDIWPPLISCVGVALVAYYGLEVSTSHGSFARQIFASIDLTYMACVPAYVDIQLWRLNLDYKYRLQDMAVEIEVLRAEADRLRQENEQKNASMSSKIFGSNKTSDGSRSKWFGIF